MVWQPQFSKESAGVQSEFDGIVALENVEEGQITLDFYENYWLRSEYGFASDESLKITLFHALGRLPEPKCTHRFW